MEISSPEKLDKYLYIKKTPTWLVRSLFIFGIFAWILVVLGFVDAIIYDPLYRWLSPIILIISLYEFLYLGTNVLYKKFNLPKHFSLLEKFWSVNREPSVDVFLPICGEEMFILLRTWENVSRLKYKNKQVYVLDDSREGCEEHKKAAENFGFNYLARPNRGEMKKAGNLRYAFQRTGGEFILILDADFAPHPDFLKETIPYMVEEGKIGILQTPQYFYMPSEAKAVNRRSALEYGAAYTQEDFYRIGQVSRDRLGGALCCGTNAVYRRAALNTIGGPLQVDKSEDSRTGFALLTKGWDIRYMPIILASGICPDNIYAYFHQQHRWASGRTELTLDKGFLKAPVSWKKKLCYVTGFLFYLQHPLAILFTFQLFYTLIKYNDSVSLFNVIPYVPYLLYWYIFLPLFRILPLKPASFFSGIAQAYSHSHAVLTALVGKSVAWISTNAKHTAFSLAFRQTMLAVAAYFFGYCILIALAVHDKALHVFDLQYYSVQFWIFWNLTLSFVLLWQMYKTMADAKKVMFANSEITKFAYVQWYLRTAGVYVFLLVGFFCGIAYLHY